MIRSCTLAWLTALTIAPMALAQPGPAPSGTAIGEYDPATGGIIVSVADINNWYIASNSAGLTGPAAATDTLPQAGGLVSDDDNLIGETALSLFSYTDVDLGMVAAMNLPSGDLNIFWNAGPGSPVEMQPVVYLGGILAGDLNGDGSINFNDLSPFVTALTDVPGYQAMFPGLYPGSCDIDGSGACNFNDLSPFVALLTGGGASGSGQVPEPATWMLASLTLVGLALGRRGARSA